MKKIMIILTGLFSLSVYSALSEEVFIRGKIGNDFNEKKVKVIDSYGQTYYLARELFPAGFKFQQGEAFAIEVNENEIDKLKIIKK
jgi:hypothetical protein